MPKFIAGLILGVLITTGGVWAAGFTRSTIDVLPVFPPIDAADMVRTCHEGSGMVLNDEELARCVAAASRATYERVLRTYFGDAMQTLEYQRRMSEAVTRGLAAELARRPKRR